MRSIVENHIPDFLEILRYDKKDWGKAWDELSFEPIVQNYKNVFENFEEKLKIIDRRDLTELSHEFEVVENEFKEKASQLIRNTAREFELSKEDFVTLLIVGIGEKDWVVVDGQREKVIAIDLYSIWKKGKLHKLYDVVYQSIVRFRHGETQGDYFDKDEVFENLKEEIVKLPDDNLLENICKLLNEKVFYYNWTGFYLINDEGLLELGPFVGEPTEHVKIPVGKGICGQAAERKVTFLIQDVSQETNYLSCSSHVKSEIVVPIMKSSEEVFGEIDIDSHYVAPFDERDREFLEWIALQLEVRLVHKREYERRIRIAYIDSYLAYLLNEFNKSGIKVEVEIYVSNDVEIVPDNLFKVWRISKKIPFVKLSKVIVVNSAEKQKVILNSEYGPYLIDYKTLNLPVSDIIHKMILELNPELSKYLYNTHYEAVRIAQAFVNASLINDYVLKPNSDLNTVLYAYLTGITAGYSASFNRAFFFQAVGEKKFRLLRALGPVDSEEAHRIWEAIEDIELNMNDFLETVSKDFKSGLEERYEGLEFDFEDVLKYADGEPHIINLLENENLKIFGYHESALMIIKSGEKILGLIIADNKYDGKPISNYQLRVLKILSNQLALLMESKRFVNALKIRATTDLLTGLGTRSALEEFLDYVERAGIYDFSIAFLDLNKFKQINDTLGHEEGDKILRKLGEAIKRNIREEDKAFRYGGDEFVLILNTTEKCKIEKIISRILESFNKETGMTFSTGVQSCEKGKDVREVLKEADQKTYVSKGTGKIQF